MSTITKLNKKESIFLKCSKQKNWRTNHVMHSAFTDAALKKSGPSMIVKQFRSSYKRPSLSLIMKIASPI